MTQQPRNEQRQQQGQVRRPPRFSAFLLTGGLAGLVLGFLLSAVGPVDARYDSSASAGFLGLIFAGLGTLAGGLIALLLEKRHQGTKKGR